MRYRAHVQWAGSTGEGWEHYDRTHTARAEPAAQTLALTTGEEKGNTDLLNPEQLVVVAASSCQMLWFLHLAAKARIDVVAYDDEAQAEMPEDRLTQIVLRPRITVRGNVSEAHLRHLCELAHQQCNIAKSLLCPVEVEPWVRTLRADEQASGRST
jgi:organic hydroperoxide reductase OsmC/OhrA